MTSPYLHRRLRSLDEVREQSDHVGATGPAEEQDVAPGIMSRDTCAVRPTARAGRSRQMVFFALALGLLMVLFALVLGEPRVSTDDDLSLEAEQMNTLAPAAGPAEPPAPAGGTDSFVNPGRSVSPTHLGPADTLAPPQPRFR